MSAGNLVQRAAGWLGGYFTWLQETLASDTARRAVLADLGLDPAATPKLEIDGERVSSIDAYRANTDVDEQAFLAVWEDILVVVESIEAFIDAAGAGEDAVVKEVLRQFLSLTSTEYVRLRWPTVFFAAKLLGVVEDRVPTGFYAVADEVITTDVFDNLLALLEAPFDHFGRVYSTPEDDAGARALANETLLPLAILLAYWDQTARQGVQLARRRRRAAQRTACCTAGTGASGRRRRSATTCPRRCCRSRSAASTSAPPSRGPSGRRWRGCRATPADPGSSSRVNGSVDLKVDLGSIWKLNTKTRRAGHRRRPRVGLRRRQRRGRPDGADRSGRPGDRAPRRRRPPTAPCRATSCSAASRSASRWPRCTPRRRTRAVISIFGTRIELGSVTVSLVIADHGVEVKVLARESALVVQKSDGDGFVAAARPRQRHPHAVRARHRHRLHAVAAAVPRRRERPAGHRSPINRAAGPIRLQQLYLELAGGSRVPEGGARFEASVGAALELGPFTASVDRLGFQVAVADSGATPSIGFKAPSGVGLLIDAEIVTGGGYLFRDAASGQYAGVLQLDFKGITLQAIGLIATQLPDGSPGFSLLLLIEAADFPPIDLAFGFRLTGVGGIVGYQRTVAVEPLRAGLKQGVLDNILFPTNVVRDAPRIVSALNTLLPDQGRAVPRGAGGPPRVGVPGASSRWSWRSSSRATRRGVSSSSASCGPPCPRSAARSSSCGWTPSGCSTRHAARSPSTPCSTTRRSRGSRSPATWRCGCAGRATRRSPSPSAACTPSSPRRPGSRSSNRVTVGLSQSANAKLTLSAYLAVTSNTAQVGARLDFLFKRSGFSVEGTLGFDALFTFHPFSFVVDLQAGVTLKWHGHTLLGVKLELTLEGTTPWRARGKATFEIWWFSKSISFDHTFGDDPPPPALPPADPTPILLTALRDRRNWSATVVGAASSLVTLRAAPPTDDVLLHPLGELSVRQRVVPLGIEHQPLRLVGGGGHAALRRRRPRARRHPGARRERGARPVRARPSSSTSPTPRSSPAHRSRRWARACGSVSAAWRGAARTTPR